MTPKLEVHPVTAIFPMMADSELEELAADIKEHGLRYPIVTQDDMLIDGRNRLKACEIAGVEPWFERLAEDADPVSYILSVNIARRHLTKGRQAMIVAMVYPEPNLGGIRKKGAVSNPETGLVHPALLSQARAVLAYSPELARAVVAGTERLSVAYEKARPDQGEDERVSVTEVAREAPAQPARSRKADLPSYKPGPQQEEPAKRDNMLDLNRVEEVFQAYQQLTPPEKRAFMHRLKHPDEIAF